MVQILIKKKMEGELLKILHQAKEAGLGASLTFTTSGGKMKAKLEVELDHSVPVPADPTPAPVKRRRQRGAGARARRNLRAAAHQASLWLRQPPVFRWILPVLSGSIPLRLLLLGGAE